MKEFRFVFEILVITQLIGIDAYILPLILLYFAAKEHLI